METEELYKTLEEMKEKHSPLFQNQGSIGDVNYCVGCKGPNDTLVNLWPCDVMEALLLGLEIAADSFDRGIRFAMTGSADRR